LGDAYVQGLYGSQITIATESNIVITGSLADAQSTLSPVPNSNTSMSTTYLNTYVNYGKPNTDSTSNLGLVSDKFTYVYRPAADGSSISSWKSSNTDNPTVNAAILAIQQCFGVQDPTSGSPQGYLRMWGSIAQNYRCTVGTSSGTTVSTGYSKAYRYDSRLGYRTPPYMLKLSDDPWRDSRIGEVSPALQTVDSTVTYPLVPSDEAGVVSRISVSSGPGTCPGSVDDCTATNSTLPVTATAPGLIVVTYTLTPSGSSTGSTRRLVILAR
jgi:hypothetical protein